MQLPESFVKRLAAELPTEAEALLEKISEAQTPVSVRLNPLKPTQHNLPLAEAIPWANEAYYLQERPIFTLDPTFHAGAYYVQEASSMLLGHVVKQLTGVQFILDLCGAPGGKSTLLASCLPQNGLLVANEILPNRAAILAENLTKWGDERVVVTNNKATAFVKAGISFDLVVCDAPCSGEGLFRRDPDAMKEWSASSPQKCATRQAEIVSSAVQLVKKGGYFIYSTCTYAVAENEAIIHDLLKQGWQPVTVSVNPDWGFVDAFKLGLTQVPGSMFRAMPHLVKGEGFFLAVLQKAEDHSTQLTVKPKKTLFRISEPNVPFYNASILKNYIIVRIKDIHYAWTPEVAEFYEQAAAKLHLIKAGIRLGKWQGSIFLPDHDSALAATNLTEVPTIELALEEARWYLSRLPFYMRQAELGWQIVTYKGRFLGWMQHLPNESRNFYPNAWRIRMSLPG